MQTTIIPTVSIAHYLATAYRPDVEYVDGRLQEKSMGQIDHEEVIYALRRFLEMQLGAKGYWVTQNTRLMVKSERIRLPDIALFAPGARRTSVMRETPMLLIEVVSPSDTLLDFEERLADYEAMGVAYIWLVDPYRRMGYVAHGCDANGLETALNLKIPELDLQLNLLELFATIPWSVDGSIAT